MKNLLFVFIFITLALTSCKQDNPNPIIESNVENVPPISPISIERFDKAFKGLAEEFDTTKVRAFTNKYPQLSKDYLTRILRVQSPRMPQSENDKYLSLFLKDTAINMLMDTTVNTFNDLSTVETKLTKHLSLYKHHFPAQSIPHFMSYFSGMNYQNWVYGDTLLIGLDLFMGKDFPYPASIPQFIRSGYDPEYIVPRTLKALLENDIPQPKTFQFIDIMIRNGKIMYALEQLIPGYKQHMITNYSEEKFLWVQENEQNIWYAFLQDELIYSIDYDKFRKHLEPSPNAPGLHPDAPGEAGSYIGWKIVKKFMENHPEISLQQLIDIDDSKYILQDSKYKPK